MSSRLKQAIISGDEEGLEQIISSLEQKDNWSLVTIIDELLPLMLMESNLRYGSFHTVKMNLFIRRLSIEGYFSKATERKLARLIAFELASRKWIGAHADRLSRMDQNISSPTERMIEELDKGNVHNALYYANVLNEEQPDALMQMLLRLGANAIPRTLGHSLSCFFPVVEDMISVDHPHAESALLTYIMYLCRYDASKDVLKEGYGQAEGTMDYGEFLKLCTSGSGIVEIHHTITFFIAKQWEHASFNKEGTVPYSMLVDWVGEKELDSERERRAADYKYTGDLPDTYEGFSGKFSFEELDTSIPCVFRMMEKRPRQAVDWLFRLYASHYKGSWDPHYYTSLYSALRLYMGDRITDKVACRMALEQAIYYFAGGMK